MNTVKAIISDQLLRKVEYRIKQLDTGESVYTTIADRHSVRYSCDNNFLMVHAIEWLEPERTGSTSVNLHSDSFNLADHRQIFELLAHHQLGYVRVGNHSFSVDVLAIDEEMVFAEIRDGQRIIADREGLLFHRLDITGDIHYTAIDTSHAFKPRLRRCLRQRDFHDPLFNQVYFRDKWTNYYPLKALFVDASARELLYLDYGLPYLPEAQVEYLRDLIERPSGL